jgi:leader peptidase (prepilin peptidase)/N-methyltransferase
MDFYSPPFTGLVMAIGAATGIALDLLHCQLLTKLTDDGVLEELPHQAARDRRTLLSLSCAMLFLSCFWRFGISLAFAAWCVFVAVMVALALIDWETTVLPDALTLPLLWCGLLASSCGLSGVELRDSVWGAATGYLSLWCIYQAYRMFTGAEGLGYGDFKLFAAIGAWGGLGVLAPAALFASIFATPIGLWMSASRRLREDKFIPLGPFLAGGGLLVVLVTPERLLSWLPT